MASHTRHLPLFRHLDALIVGLVVLLTTLGCVFLLGYLLHRLSAQDLLFTYRGLATARHWALIAVLLVLGWSFGIPLERGRPLAISSPACLLQHAVYGVVLGLLLGLGAFVFFWDSFQRQASALVRTVRFLYSWPAILLAYWLVYALPKGRKII